MYNVYVIDETKLRRTSLRTPCMIKILILNYWHKNNIEWFKKDVGYWESYE